MLRSAALPEPADVWPPSLPLLKRVRSVPLDAPVTLLVGENGSGKSTLLEALAIATELPAAGSRDRPADDPSLAPLRPLADGLRLDWTARSRRGLFLRAEDFFGYVREQNARDAEARREAARLARERRYRGDLDARSHGGRSWPSSRPGCEVRACTCSTSRRRR